MILVVWCRTFQLISALLGFIFSFGLIFLLVLLECTKMAIWLKAAGLLAGLLKLCVELCLAVLLVRARNPADVGHFYFKND